MTKTDLIAQVAANTEMSKKSAELAVNAAFDALSKAMAEGEKITPSPALALLRSVSAQSARASTPAPVSPSPSLLPRALSLSRARL